MSTYGEQFGSDTIRPLVRGFTVDDFDAPPLVEVKVDLTPSDGAKALPVGDKGPDGDRGEPALPMHFAGYVEDDDEIPDESILGPYDDGKVWANKTTGSFWLWDGDSFMEIPDGLGVPGPVGPPGSISVGTVQTSPAGGVAAMEAVGSPLARKFNIILPRGFKGPDGDPGPSGAIRQASDYSNATPPNNGDILEWDELMQKFKPIPAKRMIGPWTLIDSDFSKASFNTASAVIASIPIPAQIFKYRFEVTGSLTYTAPAGASYYAQVVPQSTGSAIARGNSEFGTAGQPRRITMVPYSGAKLTPSSTAGEMPANAPQTLTVQLVRVGTGAYNVTADDLNNLSVWLIPT